MLWRMLAVAGALLSLWAGALSATAQSPFVPTREVLNPLLSIGVAVGLDRNTRRFLADLPQAMQDAFVTAVSQGLDRFDKSQDKFFLGVREEILETERATINVIAEAGCLIVGTRTNIEQAAASIFSLRLLPAPEITPRYVELVKMRASFSLATTPLAAITGYGDVSARVIRTMCSIPDVRRAGQRSVAHGALGEIEAEMLQSFVTWASLRRANCGSAEACYRQRYQEVEELLNISEFCDIYPAVEDFKNAKTPEVLFAEYQRNIGWFSNEEVRANAFKDIEQAFALLARIEGQVYLLQADRKQRLIQAEELYNSYLLPQVKLATQNYGHAQTLFNPRSPNPNRAWWAEREARAQALVAPLREREKALQERMEGAGMTCFPSDWYPTQGYKCVYALYTIANRFGQRCPAPFFPVDPCPSVTPPEAGRCRGWPRIG